jgi:hypothetical protein
MRREVESAVAGGSNFVPGAGLALLVAVFVADGCSSSQTTGDSTTSSTTMGNGSTGSTTVGPPTSSAAVTTPDASANTVAGATSCSLPSPGLVIYTGMPTSHGTPPDLDAGCPGNILLPGGGWFSYNDGTVDGGTPVTTGATEPGCGDLNNCAYRASGTGFTGYGAGIGFSLNSSGTADDAGAAWTGIQFWVKGATTGTRGQGYSAANNTVHVKFVTSTFRDGDDYGAYCPTQGDPGAGVWVLCQIPFASLTRDGFSAPQPRVETDQFDVQNLEKVEFEFSSYMAPADSGIAMSVSFDIAVDDIAFY